MGEAQCERHAVPLDRIARLSPHDSRQGSHARAGNRLRLWPASRQNGCLSEQNFSSSNGALPCQRAEGAERVASKLDQLCVRSLINSERQRLIVKMETREEEMVPVAIVVVDDDIIATELPSGLTATISGDTAKNGNLGCVRKCGSEGG